MKRSRYARKIGISDSTALRWFHSGAIKGYQAPSGTIVVIDEPDPLSSSQERTAIYARVSPHEHKDRLTRCGFRYLEVLMQNQGRIIEGVNTAEND
jgi:putative resolvase